MAALMLVLAQARAEPNAAGYFSVEAAATPKLAQGESGKLTLSIKTKEGAKVSHDAPLKITLRSEGLKLEKTELRHDDAVSGKGKSPQFVVPFTATVKGAQAVDADLSFFVCTDQWCLRQTQKLQLKVDVK